MASSMNKKQFVLNKGIRQPAMRSRIIAFGLCFASYASLLILEILNHQANVPSGKNNEDNDNEFFHRMNSFQSKID